MQVRAARGAIRIGRDDAEVVLDATARCLGELLERNGVAHDDLVSVLFTVTDDLRSAFPAEAARRMGLGDVPLMCAREIPVAGAMPKVDPDARAFPFRPVADGDRARLPRRGGGPAR